MGKIVVAAAMGAAGFAAAAVGQPVRQAEFVPGEVIVRFDGPPTPGMLARAAAAGEVVAWRAVPHAPHAKGEPGSVHPLARYRVALLGEGADESAAGARIEGLEGVSSARPNRVARAAFIPNDPRFIEQYGPQRIGAVEAWDTTLGDLSVVLAIADSGINYDHEDFQGAIWVNAGEIPANGIDDDGNGYIDDVTGWDALNDDNDNTDQNGHGSQVAGIAAARIDNGVGVAGMAQVRIMPIQVFSAGGGGSFEAIAEAIFYAVDNGARALNYSGGGTSTEPILDDAVLYAAQHGLPVIAAAGNGNTATPHYPAYYPSVLAISGTDINDDRYVSSQYGSWIDVAGPAVDVLSCGPSGASDYISLTGTSMASPHAAGLAALMLTLDPTLTPADIREVLRATAEDLGEPGFDPYFGHGRINADAALRLLRERTLVIRLADGPPDLVPAGEAVAVRARVTGHNGHELLAGSVMAHVDAGGGFADVPLSMVAEDEFEGEIGPFACGEAPGFYLSAMTTTGEFVTLPPDAPATLYAFKVGERVSLFADDFEADLGWTVTNLGATEGDWERGVPFDNPSWPWDPESDGDGSGQCWVTGNVDRDDVDSGATALTSPRLDMSAGDVRISYLYFLNINRSFGGDGLLVEVNSDDGAGDWTTIAYHEETRALAWTEVKVDQDALDSLGVALTDRMRLRFTAIDSDPQGIVEAGVDGVMIEATRCACPADLTGSTDPNDQGYGEPDGVVDDRDYAYFLDRLALGDLAMDFSGSSDPGDQAYGAPDGRLDSADFFWFLDRFADGCR